MYIYITTNKINNKKYIGLSTRNSDESKMYYGSGILLQKAIKKYGKHNFYKEIIENNISDFITLCEKEKYYINKYNAVNSKNFYNIEEGGLSTSFWNSCSDEFKIKTKNKISYSLKQYYINNPRSIEDILKIKNSINLYYIKKYEFEFELYDKLYINNKYDLIYKYKRKKSYKLWIKDKIDLLYYFKKQYLNKIKYANNKIIYQFTKDGIFLEKYNSVLEAAKKYNINKGNLSSATNGKRNYCANYRWSYSDKPNNLIINKIGRKNGSKNLYKIKRNHVNSITNEVYIYDKDMNYIETIIGFPNVAKKYNLSYQMVNRASLKNKLYKGYYFKKGKLIKQTKYI